MPTVVCVTPSQQRSMRGRADRCSVELGIAQAAIGEPLQGRHFDGSAEWLPGTEAGVIPDYEEHVRRVLLGLWLLVRFPVRDGVSDIDVYCSTPGWPAMCR
jgi:hypothetical protein